jgi:hypothetical protein
MTAARAGFYERPRAAHDAGANYALLGPIERPAAQDFQKCFQTPPSSPPAQACGKRKGPVSRAFRWWAHLGSNQAEAGSTKRD